MNITKIKFNANETTISYEQEVDSTENNTTLKCAKPRDPAFTKAVEEISPLVIKMLGLPDDWQYDLTFVQEIALNHSDKSTHYRVTLLRKHSWFLTPIVIKSPSFTHDQMPEPLEFKLQRIQEHAREFIRGKREQKDLFGDSKITFSTVDPETGEIIGATLL